MNAVSPHFAATAPTDPARLTLRVLAGRSEGAEHSIPQDRKVMIGHSYENDVVLRNAETRGIALHLTPRGKLAVLEVIAGEIMVLGRSLTAGERIMLEPYVPVRVGGIVFAIGEAAHERWETAHELARHDPVETLAACDALPRTNVKERLELRTQPMRSRYGNMLFSPQALLVAAALMLAIAGGGFAGTVILAPGTSEPEVVAAELAGRKFQRLSVERASDGSGLAIVGLVADEDELLRLREWAKRTHPDVTLSVATLESVAEAADNLLAAHNVDAEVRPKGVDSLLIETEFLPKDRQIELEALLQRDLPRVRDFAFSVSAVRGESDLAYFFNAPGYGAASFVSGDPGYIVTEDGTRWFAGASLPTGHTIVEIGESSVTVERDGQRDALIM